MDAGAGRDTEAQDGEVVDDQTVLHHPGRPGVGRAMLVWVIVNRPFDVPLVRLPTHSVGVPWPGDDWPLGDLPGDVELGSLIAEAADPDGPLQQTYAVVIVHRGRLVLEWYDGLVPQWDRPGKPVRPETPLLSWSMAKSMLHAAVGMLVAERRLVLDDPAPVPEWQEPNDPRSAITLQHLLDMRDGLDFTEEYDDPEASDVLEMLFGRGRSDMAAFAADRPLAAPPGTRFNYSTGTSNVISGVVAREVGPGESYRAFLEDRLFRPLGMGSATVRVDDAGTWVAGSYVYASARDYARFGLLYLRDGWWGEDRLLPEGWVDHGRRPRSVDPDGDDLYGSHWWTRPSPYGTFWAAGHEGQYIDVCPGLDLIVVRLGRTDADHTDAVKAWRTRVIEAFAPTPV